MKEITNFLKQNQDLKYREFHSKLIPNIDKETIIGVRTPVLRKYAKHLKGTDVAQKFISDLPHSYFEENNLHGFILEDIKEYDQLIYELERFLPYIDNWATCDGLFPKIFKGNADKLKHDVLRWVNSNNTYTVRFGILCIMRYFLEDDNFDKEYHNIVAGIVSDEYYIKMMQAWYFATALAKQRENTMIYFESGKLDTWVHNKAIQKSIESFRIDSKTKTYLKSLKKRSE